ncbi:MAG TPA: DUF3795 domain-containing protein [Dehalococcoidales bacterium]|nr:DUF3795 domain-containing protein [Dehalococcoidales bacterium]
MEEKLIGLCGMNCEVCEEYLAGKQDVNSKGLKQKYCAGCKAKQGKECVFTKNCQALREGSVKYCSECGGFPCTRLQQLDKRYRSYYHMSMIENLHHMKMHGMQGLLEREEKKWRCPKCGGTICCHNGICYTCGVEELRAVEKVQQWNKEKWVYKGDEG